MAYLSLSFSAFSDCRLERSGRHKAVEVLRGRWNWKELAVVSLITSDLVWWLSRELMKFSLFWLVSSSTADMRRIAPVLVSLIELVCRAYTVWTRTRGVHVVSVWSNAFRLELMVVVFVSSFKELRRLSSIIDVNLESCLVLVISW